MLQFVRFADPHADMRVQNTSSVGGDRQMTWAERFEYYEAKMKTIPTYGDVGRCVLCREKRHLVPFHPENKETTQCKACIACITLYSFRNRALNHGRDPVCAYCRRQYNEQDLVKDPNVIGGNG
jgi:hypothetical protein